MDKTNDARRDEVFAVGTATAWVERPRSNGPREVQVREDAFVGHRVL